MWVLFALLAWWPSLLYAQQAAFPVQDPNGEYTDKQMNKYLLVWEEKEGVNPEEILSGQLDSQFVPMPDSTTVLKRNATYWGKIILGHRIESDLEWLLSIGQNSYTDVYVKNSRGGFDLLKAGFFHTTEEKALPEGRMGELPLALRRGEQTTIYIRAQSVGNYPVRFNISLRPIASFHKEVYASNTQEGFVAGAIIIMALYNLLYFFLSRDKAYLYYSGYIFFSGLYYMGRAGFTKDILMEGGLMLWQSAWIYAIGLSPIFYLLFMREFLQTNKEIPKWDKVYKWAIRVFVAGLAVQLIFFYFFFDLRIVVDLSVGQTLISYFFLLISLIGVYKVKNLLSKYFMLGSLALWLGVIVGMIVLFVVDKRHGNSFVPFGQAGILAEIVLFSLGLGYRARKNEIDKRKAQDGLIIQLKENEQLQTKVNRELETKVQERTAELDAQKEELAAQRDNIEVAYTEISSQNEIIEKKNQDITASINYAKRIQTAILPSPSRIKQAFDDAFVLFLPRDIVSGDFYWHADLGEYQVVAAVDCTGHGVPGAIMSMIGNDLLNEAVHLQKLSSPAEVLEYMDEHLKERLQQDDNTSVQDGMDLSICFIDKERKKVTFAGAKSSLLYIQNNEIKEVKGDKRAIGGHHRAKGISFSNQTITFETETYCYQFSDGYQDQFGGESGRKFMKSNMRKILLDIHQKPMAKQEAVLRQTLLDWMGPHRQIDDILVMGFKL